MIELLISTGAAFIFGSIVVTFHHKARFMVAREAAHKQLEKERREQVEQERYLELRDMFEYNEPEWHLLNEAAGQPDFHEQNKPVKRKPKPGEHFTPTAGGEAIKYQTWNCETRTAFRDPEIDPRTLLPSQPRSAEDVVALLRQMADNYASDLRQLRQQASTPPPIVGTWQPPSYITTEDVYKWHDWGNSSRHRS